jgi:carbonic anhydrase
LNEFQDPERKHSALVELNVIEQCLNIFKTGIVQRKRLQVREQLMQDGMTKEEARKHTYPRIHGLVFDFNTGLLKSLPVDFGRRVGSLDHIYGLYDTRKKN